MYRFSEDLDFTLTSKLSVHQLREILEETGRLVQQRTGLRMDAREVSVDPSKDAFGMQGLEGRLYWDEAIFFGAKKKPLDHPYSDAEAISPKLILTYSLEETVIEKLRAFSGQRRYAIARDVFDLHFLNKQTFDKEKAFALFPQKCEVKGLRADDIDLPVILDRREKYALNWRTNLEYLVPNELRLDS